VGEGGSNTVPVAPYYYEILFSRFEFLAFKAMQLIYKAPSRLMYGQSQLAQFSLHNGQDNSLMHGLDTGILHELCIHGYCYIAAQSTIP
jgi:hypothetical protein